MSMFDTIIFETAPVKCECGHEQLDFQTKQYECMSDVYKITKNNELLHERQVWQMCEAYKKDKNARPLMESKHISWDVLDWTDTIYCYSHCDKCQKFWFDIVIIFVHGKFDSIDVQKRKLDYRND